MDVYGFTVRHSADPPPPRAAITSRYIGCGVAASANSCIDFWAALDLAFYVYDTCARLLLHDSDKGFPFPGLGKNLKPDSRLSTSVTSSSHSFTHIS